MFSESIGNVEKVFFFPSKDNEKELIKAIRLAKK